jgi:hypothetical protein
MIDVTAARRMERRFEYDGLAQSAREPRVACAPRGEAVSLSPQAVAAIGVAFVLLWSLTYLVRQPGVAGVAAQPFSLLGNFALEGIALSLAWLGLLVSACVALLRGAIVITPGR